MSLRRSSFFLPPPPAQRTLALLMESLSPMPVGDASPFLLWVGHAPPGNVFADAALEVRQGLELVVVEDVVAAAESLSPPLLLLLAPGSSEHGAALADAVAGARRIWGYRIPAVVFLEDEDDAPQDTRAWYLRGANCVIQIPRSAKRARLVAVAALRYWLDVVALPPAW